MNIFYRKNKEKNDKIFCGKCNLLWNKDGNDNKVDRDDVVQCDNCKKWYHSKTCTELNQLQTEQINDNFMYWYCS